ncbi:MAG: SprB repeat-containing protein, partial [Bacteroidota bacterium]
MRKENFFSSPAMRRFALSVLIIGSLAGNVQRVYATHAAGADLTYRFISRNGTGDTYEITGSFYRDCSGVAAPTTLPITISSVICNYTNSTYSLPKIAGTGQEITFPCSTSQTKCTNAASPILGFQKYVYRGNVVFPSQCTDWRISYSVLARNCAITTMQQGNPCGQTTAIYVEATLNNLNFTSNNSPTFSNNPVAFICQFQSFVFNHGVTDLDGDSLYFELIDAMQSHNVSIPYIAPYSGINPLTSTPVVSINSLNGDITMNAQQLEIGVIAIRIKEYRNGILIGSIIRDMQFIVNNCYPNVLPTATGINGTNVFTATVCPGNTLSFFINSNDTNVANTVTMTWNSGITGATFTTAGLPHPTGTFTWTPTLAQARPQPYTFTVTVRDDNCPANAFQTYSYTIYVPDIQSTFTKSAHNGFNISCFGGSDGAVSAIPTGGNSPYTYIWSSGATTALATGLSAGNYTVTVSDANGCTKTFTQSLTQPPDLVSSLQSQSNILCNGASTGSASVIVTGGVPGYTYVWNSAPPQANDTMSGVLAGSYNAIITDVNGCRDTVFVTLTQPTAIVPVIDAVANVTCYRNANGAISISVSGGTPGYTYSWSPGGYTTQDVTGLDTGTYVVTITDTNGCTKTASATITEPGSVTPLPGLPVSSTDLLCYNDSSGTAAVNIILLGGTPPYTYAWSNGNVTSSVSGLHAGSTTITITDALGCTADTTFIISEPLPLTTGITNPSPYFCGFDVSCNGLTDANIDLSVGGGTPPYAYNWNAGTYVTEDLNAIGAGVYNVTITDTNGCIANDTYTVTEPAPIVVNISSPVNAGGFNIACKGESSGIIHTAVTGGCAQYSYDWGSGPVPEDSLTGLPANFYSVTVVDQNGCSNVDTITLTEPDTLVPLITSIVINGVNITCFGGADGQVFLDTIIGGSPPYTWTWNTGSATDTLTGVGAGQYSVHVIDVNGCSNDALATLSQPDPIASQLSTSHYNAYEISCNGSADGFINIDTVFGGVPSYTFSWSTGSTIDSIGGLTAGVYTLVITDTNGCVDSVDIPLTEPDAFIVSATISDVNGYSIGCNSNTDGTIDLSLFGGTGNYFYVWSNGETTSSLTGLAAGPYCATITDDNGCQLDTCFTLTEPPPLGTTDSVSAYNGGTNISCFSLYDGYAGVTVTGGVPNYTVVWSTGDTALFINSIPAGTYTYTVTDSSGCTFSNSVTLNEPQPLSVVQDSTNSILCNGDTSGCIYLTVNGGTGPFTYYWPNEDSVQDQCNLGAGVYQVTVTDANGCVSIDTFGLIEPTALANAVSLSLFTGNNVQCNGGTNGYIVVNESGGTPGYSYTWTGTAATGDTANNLGAGTYSVIITDANGCMDSASATLTEPPAFTLNGIFSLPTTCGSTNGSAWIDLSGGIPPYTFLWNNGQLTDTATGLSTGMYSVTVTDSAGCTYSDSVFVNNTANLSATLQSQQDVSCFGSGDATATVLPSGGTPPFTYLWSDAQTTQTAVGLVGGAYFCIVTDTNGCTITVNGINILEPVLLTGTATPSPVLCNGDSTGSATANPSGGTAPYSYNWQNGDTTQTSGGLAFGTYTCTITDAHGCDTTISVSISEPTVIVASVSHANVDCHGNATGSDSAFTSGGTPNYTYLWSSGATTQIATGLLAGTYTVTITDANGCSIVLTDTITESAILDASIALTAIDSVNCNGGMDGSATVTVGGGSFPYTYSWSSGATTATASNLGAGNYTVSVTDANGCTTTVSATIDQPVTLAVNVGGTGSTTCNAGSDGIAIANVVGGTPAFTYVWSPVTGSNDTLTGLPAGTYSVTVTDFNGCTGSGTFTINEPVAITTTATAPAEVCGPGVSLAGGLGANQVGTWSSNPAGVIFDDNTSATANASGLQYSTTDFIWNITDTITGCTASDTVQVLADEQVVALIDSADQEICLHSPLYDGHFHIAANPPGVGTGVW